MIPRHNKCSFIGRTSRNAEIKTFGETEVATVSMAVNNSVKKDGKWEETTMWVNVTAFNRTARILAAIPKGQGIFVEGTLMQETYFSKAADAEKTILKLNAFTVAQVTEMVLEATEKPKSDNLDWGPSKAEDDDVPF